jgi:hypothetical protein
MGIFGDGYTYTLFAPLVMATKGAKLKMLIYSYLT